MTRILKDNEIQDLIKEEKILPLKWQSKLKPKLKSRFQFEESSLSIKGKNGNIFRIIIRSNKINAFDFSIILVYRDNDGKEYRIVRYQGKHSSEHTNKWEKGKKLPNSKFKPAFHIHKATQRYQEDGFDIDGYAEITSLYNDFTSALDCFLKDNNFIEPKTPQLKLSLEVY